MKKDLFSNILQQDEEILWVDGINKRAYTIKKLIHYINEFLIIILSFGFIVAIPTIVIISQKADAVMLFKIFKVIGIILVIIFLYGIIYNIIKVRLICRNTFLAITDKRIIKRSGILNSSFIHYSLKNVGKCEVVGDFFDKRGANGSATLIVTVKDFHNNTDGNAYPEILSIENLNNAYKAYSFISEKTDGNNESLRVKIEK